MNGEMCGRYPAGGYPEEILASGPLSSRQSPWLGAAVPHASDLASAAG